MIFRFGRYTLDVDVEKTKAFYNSNLSVTTSESCSCDRCQRFPAAIMASSSDILSFLYSLGIDPRKAGEVYGYLDEEHYSGWYHIVGRLLDGRISGKVCDADNAFIPDEKSEFMVWFGDDREKMGWIEKGFPEPIVEMDFEAVLPITE